MILYVKCKHLTPVLSLIGVSKVIAKLISTHKTIDIGRSATHMLGAEGCFGLFFAFADGIKRTAQQFEILNHRQVWFEFGD